MKLNNTTRLQQIVNILIHDVSDMPLSFQYQRIRLKITNVTPTRPTLNTDDTFSPESSHYIYKTRYYEPCWDRTQDTGSSETVFDWVYLNCIEVYAFNITLEIILNFGEHYFVHDRVMLSAIKIELVYNLF